MFAKTLSAALLGSTLIATAALAQNPGASPSPSTSATTSSSAAAASHSGQWRASKLVGVNVYNDNNESLGEINELLTDQQGKIQAVVIGVGGFLGMGERNVAIPFEKIKFSNEPVKSSGPSASNSGSSASPSASGSTTMAPSTTTGSSSSSSSSSSRSSNQWYPDHAILSVSKDELKAMPEFKYST